ncbi:MAG: hypothetical protein LKM35_00240 [Lachnospiraceae bacterium]|nr:hypothetical protein [Lachnospiraceae bacterium]MCI1726109.1 hypothetical protein [Lachnospiraceae bacterium]
MNEEKKIDEKDLEGVAGGFVGTDKYSESEYDQVGIKYTYNIFSRDTYNFDGLYVNQATAEELVYFHRCMGRKPTAEELKVIMDRNT